MNLRFLTQVQEVGLSPDGSLEPKGFWINKKNFVPHHGGIIRIRTYDQKNEMPIGRVVCSIDYRIVDEIKNGPKARGSLKRAETIWNKMTDLERNKLRAEAIKNLNK